MNENLVAAVQHLHAAVAVLCGLLPAGHAADKSLQQAAVAMRRLADEVKGSEPKPAKEEMGDKKRAGPPAER